MHNFLAPDGKCQSGCEPNLQGKIEHINSCYSLNKFNNHFHDHHNKIICCCYKDVVHNEFLPFKLTYKDDSDPSNA